MIIFILVYHIQINYETAISMNYSLLSRLRSMKNNLFDRRSIVDLIPLTVMLILWNLIANRLMRGISPIPWMFGDQPLIIHMYQSVTYAVVVTLCMLWIMVGYLPGLPSWYSERVGWKNIGVYGARTTITIICLFVAYHFAVADINLYANQEWLFDRIALLVLAALVYVNPKFALLFVVYAINYNGHLKVPVGKNSFHHIYFVFELLILFNIFLAWFKTPES
jgi:hypothetical protein